jgi:hypothetical protein
MQVYRQVFLVRVAPLSRRFSCICGYIRVEQKGSENGDSQEQQWNFQTKA